MPTLTRREVMRWLFAAGAAHALPGCGEGAPTATPAAAPDTLQPAGTVAHASLVPLVSAATLAASSHNTQPWRFVLEPERVTILPDFARRCPQVDPDDHHLYASLGCAAENLVLAAAVQGQAAEVTVRDGGARGYVVDVSLAPTAAREMPLAAAISARQCTRAAYDGKPVPPEALRALATAGSGRGVSLILVTDAKRMEGVAEYVAQGNVAQIGDARWREELVDWIRFNRKEAELLRDGLYGKASGNPEVPRLFGKLFMKFAFSAQSQNEKDVPWIRSSSGVAVFVSEVDDPAHWVEAGRCYERFALQATALGIRNAFINQPVEVPALRAQFAQWLGIGARRPDLVVRFGYGPEMPRSLRRRVEDVIAPT